MRRIGQRRAVQPRNGVVLLACAALILTVAGCSSGPLQDFGRRVVANDWALVDVSPDQRVLLVRTSYGGEASDCNRWMGAEVDQREDRVSVRMLLSKAVLPGGCTDELVTRSAIVRLSEPLGDRELVGCGAGPPVCRDALRDAARFDGRARQAIVADGTVVVTDGGGLVALTADDGRERWRRAPAAPHSPVELLHARDGLVFIGDASQDVVALDAATGTERWRVARHDIAWPSALDPPGTPAVMAGEATVMALDPLTGAERWARPLPAGLVQGVGVGAAGAAILVTPPDDAPGGEVHLLDLADGTPRWSARVPERVHGVQVSASSVLTAGPAVRYAWDAAGGAPRWRLPPLAEFAEVRVTAAGPVALSDKAVFFDELTGEVRRRVALTAGDRPAAVEADRLLVPTPDGTVRVLDLDGVVRDELPLGGLGGTPSSGAGVIAVPTPLGLRVFGDDGELRWYWVTDDDEAV